MGKIFDNFINVTIINKFGGDKKIELASGKESEGVLVLSSPLRKKAIDLSKNSPRLYRKRSNKRLADNSYLRKLRSND